MNNSMTTFFWLTIFGITMGYFESAVVVYLRAIYYPEGFTFPLRAMTDQKIAVEIFREAASIIMLLSVAALAGRKFRERFAYFIFSFGIWDIFYYVWLKLLLGWPVTFVDWDVLFLIPLPWIGPVIAPLSIAVLMLIGSVLIINSLERGFEFKPTGTAWLLGLAATAIILYSFMYDTEATLHQQMPKPYKYELLIIGNLLYIGAFVLSYLKPVSKIS